MKSAGIKIFLIRAFEYGSAISASTAFGQGLVEYDDDGRILHEPHAVYQFGNEFSRFLNDFERFIADRKPRIYEAFQRVNSDEEWDDEDSHAVQLVLHCTDPHPQLVLEVRKVLKRYFDDEDLYELVDITIKMDPRRVEDAQDRKNCEKFQADLFA